MSLVKIKNPVEYSFYRWIKHCPSSSHPFDMNNFYKFVRNVCSYNATTWDVEKFEKRVLEEKPNFNRDRLQDLAIQFETCKEFKKTARTPSSWFFQKNVDVSNGYYLEKGVNKNGEFYSKEKSKDDYFN